MRHDELLCREAVLPEDAEDLLRRACAAKNRWGQLDQAACPFDAVIRSPR
jgi:hypothetical protein